MNNQTEMLKILLDAGLDNQTGLAIVSAFNLGTAETMEVVVTDENLKIVLAERDTAIQKMFNGHMKWTIGIMLTISAILIGMVGSALAYMTTLVH